MAPGFVPAYDGVVEAVAVAVPVRTNKVGIVQVAGLVPVKGLVQAKRFEDRF